MNLSLRMSTGSWMTLAAIPLFPTLGVPWAGLVMTFAYITLFELTARYGLGNVVVLSLAGAGEGWFFPELGGHGIGLIAVDVDGLLKTGRLSVELNTDTLRVSLGKIRFAEGLLEGGVNAAGEALFAGLLPDYFRKGEMDESRGFAAHYAAGAAYLKANLPGGNYVSLTLGVRKWFFTRRE